MPQPDRTEAWLSLVALICEDVVAGLPTCVADERLRLLFALRDQ